MVVGRSGGRTTVEAMIVLAERNDEYGVCAPTLCRPFYELATRLLWAARAPDGWQRLLVSWFKQNLKWADRLVGLPMPITVQTAEQLRDQAREGLSRKDQGGNAYKAAPDMWETLRQIEQEDVRDGVLQEGQKIAERRYAQAWIMLCRPAHGHVGAIDIPPGLHLPPTAAAASAATFALLSAAFYEHIRPTKDAAEAEREAEIIAERFGKAMQGETDPGPANTEST